MRLSFIDSYPSVKSGRAKRYSQVFVSSDSPNRKQTVEGESPYNAVFTVFVTQSSWHCGAAPPQPVSTAPAKTAAQSRKKATINPFPSVERQP